MNNPTKQDIENALKANPNMMNELAGKLRQLQGSYELKVSHTSEQVSVDIGTAVQTLGFTPEGAITFANLLLKHAKLAKKGKK